MLTNGWDALAFDVPNQTRVDGPITRYLVTIGTIERRADLTLLTGLQEAEQVRLRTIKPTALWR